jgi:hypothetical protein
VTAKTKLVHGWSASPESWFPRWKLVVSAIAMFTPAIPRDAPTPWLSLTYPIAGPKIQPNDWSNHLPLPRFAKAGQWRHGSGV